MLAYKLRTPILEAVQRAYHRYRHYFKMSQILLMIRPRRRADPIRSMRRLFTERMCLKHRPQLRPLLRRSRKMSSMPMVMAPSYQNPPEAHPKIQLLQLSCHPRNHGNLFTWPIKCHQIPISLHHNPRLLKMEYHTFRRPITPIKATVSLLLRLNLIDDRHLRQQISPLRQTRVPTRRLDRNQNALLVRQSSFHLRQACCVQLLLPLAH